MRSKRLIVNADDFGWTRGITDAILLAHGEGIVTSTTLMVNQPATDYALEQAARVPRLGIGIHLNLCNGSPVLNPEQVPTLVTPDGKFYPAAEVKRRLWRGEVRPAEIEAEFRAQIQWLRGRAITPTHADTHHNLHFHFRVAVAFRRALLAEGIRRVRSPRLRHWPRYGYFGGPRPGPIYRRLAVAAYMRLLDGLCYREFASPDCCIEPHPRDRDNLARLGEGWKLLLERMPPGTFELACHPGTFETGFSENDPLRERRETELRLLVDPHLRNVVEEKGIDLINYCSL